MKTIDIVKNNNMAHFSHYCGGNLYYTVNVDNSTYLFNINTDPKEVGTATFSNEIKALTLMRWINICLKNEEFVKIK
jgi:hypothetical protein